MSHDDKKCHHDAEHIVFFDLLAWHRFILLLCFDDRYRNLLCFNVRMLAHAWNTPAHDLNLSHKNSAIGTAPIIRES